jgi:Mce-associated membrane protein
MNARTTNKPVATSTGTATDPEDEMTTRTETSETAEAKAAEAETAEARDAEPASADVEDEETGPETEKRRRTLPNPLRLLRAAPGRIGRGVVAAGRVVSRRMEASSRRTRLVVLGVLAALVVCAGAGVGVLAWQDSTTSSVDAASAAALDAARTKLPLVLSYKAATLDTDLDRARQQITGTFGSQFDQLAAATIVPSTRDQKITTTATVARGAVISATPDRVETLLFVNQTTTSASRPQPQATASQVRVVMTPVAGQWLISEVTPI